MTTNRVTDDETGESEDDDFKACAKRSKSDATGLKQLDSLSAVLPWSESLDVVFGQRNVNSLML